MKRLAILTFLFASQASAHCEPDIRATYELATEQIQEMARAVFVEHQLASSEGIDENIEGIIFRAEFMREFLEILCLEVELPEQDSDEELQ